MIKKLFLFAKNNWALFKNRNKIVEVSFSRIQAYVRCPWMYHLVFDQRWRSGPNGSMALGVSLHKTLAEFLSDHNPDRSLNRLMEIYDQMWVNEGHSNTQQTLDAYDNGRKMLELFFENEQTRKSKVVGTEVTFKLNMKNLQFWGTVDRIDLAPDGFYEIVEYKTQADHWTSSRVENDLQLTLYELGVREGLGYSPLRLKYYFLSSGEYVEAARSEEQKTQARNMIFDTAKKIRQGHFPPNHGHCQKCEFVSRCEKKGGIHS